MPTRAIEVTVRGLVQGVGFRWFVSRAASTTGVTGWVANQPDGSVAVVAEGDPDALEALVAALHEGPPGASVSSVEVRDRIPTGSYGRFEIRSWAHRGDGPQPGTVRKMAQFSVARDASPRGTEERAAARHGAEDAAARRVQATDTVVARAPSGCHVTATAPSPARDAHETDRGYPVPGNGTEVDPRVSSPTAGGCWSSGGSSPSRSGSPPSPGRG